MGWRRRHRTRPQARCSLKAYRQAHDKGLGAFASYVKTCGYPAGIKPRPASTVTKTRHARRRK